MAVKIITPWWAHWYTAWLVIIRYCGYEIDLKRAGSFVARHSRVRIE